VRVISHCTDGLGQMTLHMCKALGARVFVATGSIENDKLLGESYDIPEDRVYSNKDMDMFRASRT